MAITKILPRNSRIDLAIQYILNGDKTAERVLTAHMNCDPGREYRQMMDTKREIGKLGGRQCYHIIQSFRPGEITPELALEIAKEFAREHLSGYEAVIGVHVDKKHIHAHTVFNSVNQDTGEKYHSTLQSYYQQIRVISDRLCREHGLSVILSGETSKSMSYVEWLRQSKGQPTFRSMLEADLRESIEDANDLGHFFLLMEHKGYEIRHGNRLGFRLRGQERFQYPGKKMQPSQRTVSALPSLAIWRKSRRVNGPLLLTGLCFVPTADTPNTRAFGPVRSLSLPAGKNRTATVSSQDDAAPAAGSHEV